jgi:uncharacterized protein
MTDNLSRAFAGDIEVRASAEGRTVTGIVVPFDRTARVSDGGPSYDEAFQRGAFAKTIAERGSKVKLLSQHNSRTNPLGRATLLREDAAGLYGEFSVSRTQAGDEALELIRDGALDSFSVGFSGIKAEKRSGVLWRTEVALREASLVTFPAYSDALVSGLREANAPVVATLVARGYMPESIDRFLETGDARDLVHCGGVPITSATTADGQPERTIDEPASATPDSITRFRHLRRIARERGII